MSLCVCLGSTRVQGALYYTVNRETRPCLSHWHLSPVITVRTKKINNNSRQVFHLQRQLLTAFLKSTTFWIRSTRCRYEEEDTCKFPSLCTQSHTHTHTAAGGVSNISISTFACVKNSANQIIRKWLKFLSTSLTTKPNLKRIKTKGMHLIRDMRSWAAASVPLFYPLVAEAGT